MNEDKFKPIYNISLIYIHNTFIDLGIEVLF